MQGVVIGLIACLGLGLSRLGLGLAGGKASVLSREVGLMDQTGPSKK